MVDNVIILAAGKGNRMKSRDVNVSKFAYTILGKPMINYVIDAVKRLSPKRIITVVGFGGDSTIACINNETEIVWQKELLGTGHAIRQTEKLIGEEKGTTLVVCGDTPLITTETLESVIHKHEKFKNQLTFVTSILDNPSGYGRVIREEKSNVVLGIKEEKRCSEDDLYIKEVNSGVYVFDNEVLFKYLNIQKKKNKDINDFNVTELAKMLVDDKLRVRAYVLIEPTDVFSVDDHFQLAYATKVIRKRTNTEFMISGVSIEDPDTAYISPLAVIGRDTIIKPNTTIIGNTVIGAGNVIGPNTVLDNVIIGKENHIFESHIENTKIGNKQIIGPFKYIK